ncbi:MAG: hypothetical protein GEU78_07330 [Actinobacteria bacterium]|nr:hypothetical protein [Actinomycetota bacterium]
MRLLPRVVGGGWPVVIELGREMPGPPDVVWRLITDWENQDDWMLEASDFTVTSEQREGAGVEAEATITIGGIRTRDRVRVVGWEPERKLVIRHEGWVSGTGEILLARRDDGSTYMYWREELSPPLGVLGAIGLSALEPLMRRIFVRDLRVLEGLVRAAAAP